MKETPLQDRNINDTMDSSWEFNEDVAAVFDEMLKRSIPQYDVMRDAVTEIAVRTCVDLPRGVGTGQVVDLGASRGEQAAQILEHRRGMGNHFHLVEVSKPMVNVLKERFANEEGVSIAQEDLRTYFPSFGTGHGNQASVVLSVLTLQFIPIEYRMQLIGKIHKLLQPGGAFLFVEKLVGGSPDIDKLFLDMYWAYKHHSGYTEEEIARKKTSLEGVLVPVTAKMNEEFLRAAGFSQVDCFWRWANFGGWVAVK